MAESRGRRARVSRTMGRPRRNGAQVLTVGELRAALPERNRSRRTRTRDSDSSAEDTRAPVSGLPMAPRGLFPQRRGSDNAPVGSSGLRDLLESLSEGPRRSRGGRRTSPLGRGEIESIEVGVTLPERTRRRPQLTARQRRIRARRRKKRAAARAEREESRANRSSDSSPEEAPSRRRRRRRRAPSGEHYSRSDAYQQSLRHRASLARNPFSREVPEPEPRRQSSRTRANQSQILERRAPSRRSRPEPRPERTSRRNDFSYEGASNAGDRAFRRLRDVFRSQVPTPIRGRSTRSRRRPSRPARTRRAQPRVSRRNDFSYEGAANAGDRASRRLAGYFGR